jgi:hypothetical protein
MRKIAVTIAILLSISALSNAQSSYGIDNVPVVTYETGWSPGTSNNTYYVAFYDNTGKRGNVPLWLTRHR